MKMNPFFLESIAVRLYTVFKKIFWRIGLEVITSLGRRASPFQVLSTVRDIGQGARQEDTDTREDLGGA
ncbi:unnamed protein product [Prunus armeniaca]